MSHHNLSGLSLYPFRAYDPSFQRWLNRDPIGERGGLNLYEMVGNNPLNRIDPYGHQPVEDSYESPQSSVPGIRQLEPPSWNTYAKLVPRGCPWPNTFNRIMTDPNDLGDVNREWNHPDPPDQDEGSFVDNNWILYDGSQILGAANDVANSFFGAIAGGVYSSSGPSTQITPAPPAAGGFLSNENAPSIFL